MAVRGAPQRLDVLVSRHSVPPRRIPAHAAATRVLLNGAGSMADESDVLEEIVLTRLARLNAMVQAIVSARLVGAAIFIATNWLLLTAGQDVASHMILLPQVFIGDSGSFVCGRIGFGYGLVIGFVAGYAVAPVANWFGIKREARRDRIKQA